MGGIAPAMQPVELADGERTRQRTATADGAGGGSLVYTPRNVHPPLPERSALDEETGEVRRFRLVSGEWKPITDHRAIRAERFALKSAANRLLPKGHRTSKCHRWRAPNQEIQVLMGQEHSRAFYHGLLVCARVWTCPVCASKISERRRAELAAAITIGEARGLRVYLVTLTIPHGLGDDLAEITGKLTDAWAWMNRGKGGQMMRQRLGLVGTVRALEVTHGANGWHPHIHALLFLEGSITTDQAHAWLAPRWQSAATRNGLPMPSDAHGCRVDDGHKAAAYVAKGAGWGIESELVKGHQKRGKRGSRTPWDLLRDYLDQDDKQAAALFRHYAEAFKGRRQLVWSRGLKALVAVQDLDDETIAAAPEDEASMLLATLTDQQWTLIRRRHHETVVLDLAETSPEALRAYLVTLRRESETL